MGKGNAINTRLELAELDDYFRVVFPAMACPCELLLDTRDPRLALELGLLARAEAQRIEARFSRYRPDSIIRQIQQQAGQALAVDDETARLLDFAEQLFQMSEGRFDITSGVLRQVWTFDGSDRLPQPSRIHELLPLIGWQRVLWRASADRAPVICLPVGMELDLGGIGKEYAVDRVMALLQQADHNPDRISVLVNFGGDLLASGPRANGQAWRVAIEHPANAEPVLMELAQGALATSGDRFRFLEKDGVRYSHILDPRSGWPVPNAPDSVTVAAPTCTQAGMLATLASLMGADADAFLGQQQTRYWILKR